MPPAPVDSSLRPAASDAAFRSPSQSQCLGSTYGRVKATDGEASYIGPLVVPCWDFLIDL